MLKIKIGSTWIDTQGIEIPVKLTSPLFLTDGRIMGSRLFNFTVPLTEPLRAETGYINRPGRYGKPVINKAFYLEFGPLKFEGTCKIVEVSKTSIEVSCPINTGNLAQLLKGIKMADVDMEGDRPLDDAPIRADAETDSDIVVDLYDPENPITDVVAVPFDDINVNPDDELAVNGLLFTVLVDTLLTIEAHINCDSLGANLAEFRIYKNTVLQKAYAINGDHTYYYDLPVLDGDVITWAIYLESDTTGEEFNLDFTLYSGSRIIFKRQGDVLNNGANLMYPDVDYAVFPIENDKFLDSVPDDTYIIDHTAAKEVYSKYFPVLNYYKDSHFPNYMTGTRNGEFRSAFNMFCQFPYLAYFVKRMALHLELQIINNVFEEDDLKQLIIYNAFAENNYVSSDLIEIIEGFNLNKHVPNVALSDFVNEVFKFLGIAVDYNSQTRKLRLANLKDIIADNTVSDFPGKIISDMSLRLELYKGYRLKQTISKDSFASDNFKSLDGLTMKGTVTIWNLLPSTGNSINDCYFVSFWKEYYVWNYDPEFGVLNWILHSKEFRHTLEDIDESADGEIFELSSDWAACMVNQTPGLDVQLISPEGRHWLIPKVQEAGNFEGMQASTENAYSKYLLFYRGLQKDSDDNDYPLATNDVFDYAGDKIADADLALRWDGQYGIYAKRLKNWVEWYLNNPGPLTFKATFTPLALSKIDWFEWYQVNGVKFLIQEIAFVIKRDSISKADVTVRKR